MQRFLSRKLLSMYKLPTDDKNLLAFVANDFRDTSRLSERKLSANAKMLSARWPGNCFVSFVTCVGV